MQSDTAVIFYSVTGEGRGHATRAGALTELLCRSHQVHLFAADDAFELLSARFAGTDVPVTRIPGVRFGHRRDGSTSTILSAANAARFMARSGKVIEALTPHFDAHRPDLVIADFEILLATIARRRGLPVLRLDHQGLIRHFDFSDYRWRIRLEVMVSRWLLRLVDIPAQSVAVSSFHFPPLLPQDRAVHRLPPLMRENVLQAAPEDGAHLTVYLRTYYPESLRACLKQYPGPVEIYGRGAGADDGNLRYRETDADRFVHSLATCRALVCTAGNQLIGEAIYLGKPVLGMPDRGKFEQEINGQLIEEIGAGLSVPIDAVRYAHLQALLSQRDRYVLPADTRRMMDGRRDAARLVEAILRGGEPAAPERS